MVDTLFLTPEQLEDLTGLRQPAAQIRWLRANRITVYVRADGRPRVPVSELQRRAQPTDAGAPSQPNFEALREAG